MDGGDQCHGRLVRATMFAEDHQASQSHLTSKPSYGGTRFLRVLMLLSPCFLPDLYLQGSPEAHCISRGTVSWLLIEPMTCAWWSFMSTWTSRDSSSPEYCRYIPTTIFASDSGWEDSLISFSALKLQFRKQNLHASPWRCLRNQRPAFSLCKIWVKSEDIAPLSTKGLSPLTLRQIGVVEFYLLKKEHCLYNLALSQPIWTKSTQFSSPSPPSTNFVGWVQRSVWEQTWGIFAKRRRERTKKTPLILKFYRELLSHSCN